MNKIWEWHLTVLIAIKREYFSLTPLKVSRYHVTSTIENIDADEHSVKKYNLRQLAMTQELNGKKDLIRYFKEHVVEVKQVKNASQISIYDFKNQMTLFCNSYNKILFVEVEEDAIYMLT